MLLSALLSHPLEELGINVGASQTPQAVKLPVRPKAEATVGSVSGSEV